MAFALSEQRLFFDGEYFIIVYGFNRIKVW